mgnify:CR=1 FL=1
MITELKKFMKKLLLSVLIVFSVFTVFSNINIAYGASYVKNQDFHKVVKVDVLLKNLSRKKEKFYVSCDLCCYVGGNERIRCNFKEDWTMDGKFKVFIFDEDHYINIARNIAWDMFKKKAGYFIVNEKQSMLDSADNVESLIFYIKDEVLLVYNDLLSRLGIRSIKNLNKKDLDYLCAEACRMYYCYALDFEAYANYCYVNRI